MSSMESSGGNANGPSEAKKQRVSSGKIGIEFDGPVDDEETAKKKLRDAGFAEGNLTQYEEIEDPTREGEFWCVSPMGHFSCIGDLKMCRYLLSKGASTVDADVVFNDPGPDNYYSDGEEEIYWFPMQAAADCGSLAGCQWLYNNGAQDDVRRCDGPNSDGADIRNGKSPLRLAWHFCSDDQNSIDLCEWLILKGALQKVSSGCLCQETLHSILSNEIIPFSSMILDRAKRRARVLLYWAKDAVSAHKGFIMFMMGALIAGNKTTSELRRILGSKIKMESAVSFIIDTMSHEEQSTLCVMLQPQITLRGELGIFEIIADFVGVARGRELRTLRQLEEALGKYIGTDAGCSAT